MNTCFQEQSSVSGSRVTISGLYSCSTSLFSSRRQTESWYRQPQSVRLQYLTHRKKKKRSYLSALGYTPTVYTDLSKSIGTPINSATAQLIILSVPILLKGECEVKCDVNKTAQWGHVTSLQQRQLADCPGLQERSLLPPDQSLVS